MNIVIGVRKTVCTVRDTGRRQGTSCVFLYCPHVWLNERFGAPVASENKRLGVEQAVSRVMSCIRTSAKDVATGSPARLRRGDSWGKANKSELGKHSSVPLINDFQVLSRLYVLHWAVFAVVIIRRGKATGCRLYCI